MTDNESQSPKPESKGESTSSIATLRTEELFQGTNKVKILHGNEVYYLRLTKQNRLILNK